MTLAKSLYHVTPLRNLSSILKSGLIPSVGARSILAGENYSRVYFFNGKEAYENGLSNWLGDSFEEGESLVTIEIGSSLIKTPLHIDEKSQFEVTSKKFISPAAIIRIQDENEQDLIFIKGEYQSLCKTPHQIVNHTDIGIQIEKFAYDNLHLIANRIGCGWSDGGCYIFAKALQIWSDKEISIGAVLGNVNGKNIVDHAVGIWSGSVVDLYLDANGLASKAEILNNQFVRPGVDVIPFPDENLEIPKDDMLSTELAECLKNEIGVFDKHLFPNAIKQKHHRLR